MILFKLRSVTLQQVNKESTLYFSAKLVKNAIQICKTVQIYEGKTGLK
jgi:hypothetical protein